MNDRIGLGWRPELAAGILTHLDRIDVVEVIAEEWFEARGARLRALAGLARRVPVVLHGVTMGLASSQPVARRRLDAMARLVDAVRPAFWSEHLAFVRGGGVEIGHLAAPPRTAATAAAAAHNLQAAATAVGLPPLVENVATLLEPPGSDLPEAEWVARTLSLSGCPLLLDLHNLYANAVNFGFDPLAFLDRLPIDRVHAVHLSGGRRVGGGSRDRLVDDHLHDVPDPVYSLLAELGRRRPGPLTVILERDGAYPPMAELLAQLERARTALRSGRRAAPAPVPPPRPAGAPAAPTGPPLDEALLARLYVDEGLRARVLADPAGEAARRGLTPAQAAALARIDGDDLALAARGFAHKRARASARRGLLSRAASML